MHTITITTYPSMPGRFRVTCSKRGSRDLARDAANAGEAAAVAIEYAAAADQYVILGHAAAVNQIPEKLRSKLA